MAKKPAASAELPFQPICYPDIWRRSNELHPRAALAYDWQEHLRTLCRLCRAYLASDPRFRTPWALVPKAEQTYLTALGNVPVEMLILDIVRERAGRADLPAWELWWADPFDSHLKPEPVTVRDGRSRPI
jgi:hypothetical protein